MQRGEVARESRSTGTTDETETKSRPAYQRAVLARPPEERPDYFVGRSSVTTSRDSMTASTAFCMASISSSMVSSFAA